METFIQRIPNLMQITHFTFLCFLLLSSGEAQEGGCAADPFNENPKEPCHVVCPSGSFSSTGQNPCQLCSVGRFSDTTGTFACKPCPIGHYSSSVGSTSCLPCAKNHYTNKLGSSQCKLCPPNSFANEGESGCTQNENLKFNLCDGSIFTDTGLCYKLFINPVSWYEAKLQCLEWSHGHGGLAKPASMDENSFLSHLLWSTTVETIKLSTNYNADYLGAWIDVTDAYQKGFWQHSDGTPTQISPWTQGKPTGINNEIFVDINSKGEWNNLSENERRLFLCYRPWRESISNRQNLIEATCSISTCDGIRFNLTHFCYKVDQSLLSYDDSLDSCSQWGGALATITSDQENEFVRLIAIESNIYAESAIWLGGVLTDIWTDGTNELEFFNWAENHPQQNETLSQMRVADGKWISKQNSTSLVARFVCKKKSLDDLDGWIPGPDYPL